MSPIRMSRLESAVRLVLEFNEAFNRHDVTGMMQLVGEDCVFENAAPGPDGSLLSGKEMITRFWQDFFAGSPQAHREVEEIFGLGSRCVLRWRCDRVGAAGAKGHLRGVDLFQVKDGLICARLSYIKGEK
jgi:limonene-1,2-epoxide hydrolase